MILICINRKKKRFIIKIYFKTCKKEYLKIYFYKPKAEEKPALNSLISIIPSLFVSKEIIKSGL